MTPQEQLLAFARNNKLQELEANYLTKKETFTTNGKTYRITQENLTDMIGLVALDQGSDIGVMENGALTLVNHTLQDLKDLLNGIRVYLTQVKTDRFIKREALKSLTDHQQIVEFDTSL